MASKTELANLALNALGRDTIVDIDQNTPDANRMRVAIDAVLDEVLEAHPFHFARARAQLAAGTAPAFEWLYSYPLPETPYCLAVRNIVVDDKYPKFVIEGRNLLCNYPAPLKIIFTARTDISFWLGTGLTAAGYRLAAATAFALTSDRNVETKMWELYEAQLRRVRGINAQQAPAEEDSSSDLIDSRD